MVSMLSLWMSSSSSIVGSLTIPCSIFFTRHNRRNFSCSASTTFTTSGGDGGGGGGGGLGIDFLPLILYEGTPGSASLPRLALEAAAVEAAAAAAGRRETFLGDPEGERFSAVASSRLRTTVGVRAGEDDGDGEAAAEVTRFSGLVDGLREGEQEEDGLEVPQEGEEAMMLGLERRCGEVPRAPTPTGADTRKLLRGESEDIILSRDALHGLNLFYTRTSRCTVILLFTSIISCAHMHNQPLSARPTTHCCSLTTDLTEPGFFLLFSFVCACVRARRKETENSREWGTHTCC